MLGRACDGHSLVYGLLSSGAAAQPNDAILIRVDMNAPRAGQMFRSELGLDFRRNGRILDERLRMRAILIRIVGQGHDRPKKCTKRQSCNYIFSVHHLSFIWKHFDESRSRCVLSVRQGGTVQKSNGVIHPFSSALVAIPVELIVVMAVSMLIVMLIVMLIA